MISAKPLKFEPFEAIGRDLRFLIFKFSDDRPITKEEYDLFIQFIQFGNSIEIILDFVPDVSTVISMVISGGEPPVMVDSDFYTLTNVVIREINF